MKWYDALPFVALQAALVRSQKGDFETWIRTQAREDTITLIPRFMRVFMSLTGPKAAAQHMPRLVANYLDFGEIHVEGIDDTHFIWSVTQVPRVMAASFVNGIVGGGEGALDLVGARQTRGRYYDVTLGEERDGFEELAVKIEFTYS